MKDKKERTANILKVMFGAMFLSVVILLFLGEALMPRENPTGSGECVQLEAEWERVFSDGTRESIKLPGRCKADRGEVIRLETVLPHNQGNIWYCMRASQQDMQVYVGDDLRKEYSTKETRLFGKNSASVFVFFEIMAEDAGKVLAIEIMSDSEYAGFLNDIYVGEKSDIIRAHVKECAGVLLVSFYMLILSSVVVLIGFILRVVYKKSVDITYLGLGILQLSLAMLSESRVRQLFLPSSSIAENVGFLLTILIPYPFMVYVSRMQKGRYEKVYRAVSICVAANFIISVLLQILDILDLGETMFVSYIFIVVMVIIIAVTICMDIAKRKIMEYGEVIFGIIAMLAVSIWEIFVEFVPEVPYHGGILLSIGLIFLLFMAGIKATRDLLAMEQEKQEAIAASEAKAKFLANMSHEIRTPINTIIGMNEMILRENRDKEVEEYALSVQNASRLLLGLISDVLDFSKIEAGKLEILETDYYLSRMLNDVVKDIKFRADSKNLSVKVDIEENLPSILRGDEIRIRQILNNLLSNAVKYTQKGTVTLTVKGMYSYGDFVLCMSVEDTGMGIKKEDLGKLFGSFQRFEENKNRYIEGTGLGLNITRQLAELMGGSIDVKSEYEKGSCFTVKIPQQIVDETPIEKCREEYRKDIAKNDARKTELYAPTAKILVVDDNELNLAVMKALLKRTAIEPAMAQGGTECLELCKHEKYDLILMDHMMPTPDGIETLHLLRADKNSLNRDTEVIVVTANAIAGMAEKYIAEGFADYLSKPIVAEELEDMILRHLPQDKLEVEEKTASGNSVEKEEEDSQKAEAIYEEGEKDSIFYIDKRMGMEYCCNNEEMYREIINTYCSQGQKYLEQLPEYYKTRDWKSYEIMVHSIKSTSLSIGATVFSEKARELEQAAVNGDEEMLLGESEKFFEEYRELLDRVRHIII